MQIEPTPVAHLPLKLGICGLGLAGAFMVRAAAAHPRIRLSAAADPMEAPRKAFAQAFGAKVYSSFDELCVDTELEAIYIATPHHMHAAQAIEALDHGKHVLVEKPLALSLEECDAIVAAQKRSGKTLIVGHTHAFDPNIKAMRKIIQSGDLGPLGMILTFNYTDFLLRPHREDEFLDERRGGIILNQMSHQVEMVRMLGGEVRSVRAHLGALDTVRKANGHGAAVLGFENGAAATLTYSSYDFFDSDSLHNWIGEGGNIKDHNGQGRTRASFLARPADSEAHQQLAFGGRSLPVDQPYLPHFGIIIATCEKGDLRLSPNGLWLHGRDGTSEIPVPRGVSRAGHGDALDALYESVRHGVPCPNDAKWGRNTLRVLLAILQSSEEDREIILFPKSEQSH